MSNCKFKLRSGNACNIKVCKNYKKFVITIFCIVIVWKHLILTIEYIKFVVTKLVLTIISVNLQLIRLPQVIFLFKIFSVK